MHRDINLNENGVQIAMFGSDHNDHNGTGRAEDFVMLIAKTEKKTQDNLEDGILELLVQRKKEKLSRRSTVSEWDWKTELNKAYEESFPYLVSKRNTTPGETVKGSAVSAVSAATPR